MKLSVIIPVYNEVESIETILKRVYDTKLTHEILVVDDGSKDGTRDKLKKLDGKKGVRVILHEVNQGKGAAVRTGMAAAKGDILLIQDADLEYDPRDYPELLKPILEGLADVVYGSRFLGSPRGHRVLYFWHSVGNRMLTMLSNMFSDLNLTDMETCYKVMRAEVLKSFALESDGFGIEPELTAKIFKRKYRVYEVPITYDGRGYEEGKKITWRDGVVALWVLLKYRFTE